MSHRKFHSQGSIPFSWEDKPGVSKFTRQGSPIDISLRALNITSSPLPLPLPPPPPLPLPPFRSDIHKVSAHDKVKIPPPPCLYQPPRRSTSARGLWWEKDPFLVAYKECTKSVTNGKLPSESKKGVGSKARKSKHTFSCKNSCDVRDDNLVIRQSNLPPLPRDHRVRELRWDS